MPERVAEPLPLSWNERPDGSEPDSAIDGVGVPAAVAVKLVAEPAVKVVLAALVIAGATGAGLIVSVKTFIAVWGGVSESCACKVKVNVPASDGVPLINPVDALRLRPGASEPDVIVQI